MITVILENENNKEVERVGAEDNRQYLLSQIDIIKFPILSEVSDSDYEIILSEDLPRLITELEKLKADLSEKQRSDVDEIIRLAKIGIDRNGYTLTFTPFIAYLEKHRA